MSKKLYVVKGQTDNVKMFPTEDALREKRNMKSFNDSKKFLSLAEKIAQDKMYYLNYMWCSIDKDTLKPWIFYVDKFFPYAKGGALYIDEPTDPILLNRCKEKEPLFKKAGLKYLIIEKGETYEQIMERLDA